MRILACGIAALALALITAPPATSGARNSKPKGTALVVGSHAIKSGKKKANTYDWLESLAKTGDSYKKITRAGVRQQNALDAFQQSIMDDFSKLEPTTPTGRKKRKRP